MLACSRPRVLSAVCCPSPGFVFQRFMSFIFHRRGPLQLRFSGRQITIFTPVQRWRAARTNTAAGLQGHAADTWSFAAERSDIRPIFFICFDLPCSTMYVCMLLLLQVVVDQCEPWSGRKIDLQIDPVYLPCSEEARALIQVSSHWSTAVNTRL